MRSRFVAALTLTASVTALSVLASPLTEGVARADGDVAETAKAAAVDAPAAPVAAAAAETPDAPAAPVKPKAKPVAHVVAEPPAPAPVAAAPVAAAPVAAAPVPEPAVIVPVAPTAIAPAPAAVVAAAPAATPLSLVPSKPLELAAPPAPASNLSWKLGAMGLLAAAGFWAYSKKKSIALNKGSEAPIPEMRILRRTSVGVRSELLLVDLEGQRILLGVTPSNIQSLLIVPDSAMSDPIPVEEPVSTSSASITSLRDMPSMAQLMKQLDTDDSRNARTVPPRTVERAASETRSRVTKRAPAKRRRIEDEIEEDMPASSSSASSAAIEGQAEGLMAYRRAR